MDAICVVAMNWSLNYMVVVGLKDLPSDTRNNYTVQVLNSTNGIDWEKPLEKQ